jgi:hypothetical protein
MSIESSGKRLSEGNRSADDLTRLLERLAHELRGVRPRVRLADPAARDGGGDQRVETMTDAELVQLVRELQVQYSRLAGEVGYLRAELAQVRETARALEDGRPRFAARRAPRPHRLARPALPLPAPMADVVSAAERAIAATPAGVTWLAQRAAEALAHLRRRVVARRSLRVS